MQIEQPSYPPAPTIYSFARPPTKGAHIRGSLFSALPSFVKQHFGMHRWEEFLGLLDPVAARVLRADELTALAWYPFRVISSSADAMAEMSGPVTAEDTLQKFARNNLDRATNLIFRAIFKVGSPEFMVGKSDQVWRKYYSSGSMKVPYATMGGASVRLFDFPEMTPNYNRVILHAVASVIVKAGGRITRQEISHDIHRGDDFCEYTYEWT
jgi:hypothetical protein